MPEHKLLASLVSILIQQIDIYLRRCCCQQKKQKLVGFTKLSNTTRNTARRMPYEQGRSSTNFYLKLKLTRNQCTQGGCCARIQAIEALENARHGGVFCGFLHREFGYAPHRPVKGRFGIEYVFFKLPKCKANLSPTALM